MPPICAALPPCRQRHDTVNGQRIIVTGPVQRSGIVGAILASRWAGRGREVVIAHDANAAEGAMLLRPDHQRLHTEIGLLDEAIFTQCKARPHFAVAMPMHGGTASLPFAPFGMPRDGVAFHQFWVRAASSDIVPDLMEFSPSIALSSAAGEVSHAQLAQLRLPFGLVVDAAPYCELLLALAARNSAQIVTPTDGAAMDADLVIDCGMAAGIAGWSGHTLKVATDCDLPGIAWQICVNAARRLTGLASALGSSAHEQREYSRLAVAEVERIADMRALLNDTDPRKTDRPALRRKVEVFTACGRIPTEDFEFFSPPEWLAAVWARGLRPRRFDRLAQVLPRDELTRWLGAIHTQVRQLSSAGSAR